MHPVKGSVLQPRRAEEYSPRRKPWVSCLKSPSPEKGRKKSYGTSCKAWFRRRSLRPSRSYPASTVPRYAVGTRCARPDECVQVRCISLFVRVEYHGVQLSNHNLGQTWPTSHFVLTEVKRKSPSHLKHLFSGSCATHSNSPEPSLAAAPACAAPAQCTLTGVQSGRVQPLCRKLRARASPRSRGSAQMGCTFCSRRGSRKKSRNADTARQGRSCRRRRCWRRRRIPATIRSPRR